VALERGLALPGAAVVAMPLGRTLIIVGLVLIAAGLAISFGARLPLRLGRLPGDIYIQGKSSSFYFPITTCIVVSLLLTLLLWIFRKLG
jgi:hypothetical protein